MLVQCARTLLERVNVPDDELMVRGDPGYSQAGVRAWHANMITIDRRKTIVLMNNLTRYPVVIYRPQPKDFSRLKELIGEAIATALRMEGVRESVINRYIADAGEIRFSKATDRSMIARMNDAVRKTRIMSDHLDESAVIQKYFSLFAGRLFVKAPDGEYYCTAKNMIDALARYSSDDRDKEESGVLDVELYQLKIQIDLEGFDVWRRVLVPAKYTFKHLHDIIQTVFDWHNRHLHLFEAKKKGSRPKHIVMADDSETLVWFDFDTHDVLQERFTALDEIFPSYRTVSYEYDFGDFWEHIITLEKVVRTGAFEALYLEGAGERPPEDVGGSRGYREYKRIMADRTDPEYESMSLWAESQKERRMSREKINALLGLL